MTIREKITEKFALLQDVDALGGHRAAEELVELTSLLSSLNKEIVDAHSWYNLKRLAVLDECKGKVSEAKIRAEASPEWKQWQERLAQRTAVEEACRALKYYLRGLENEQRLV